jgi:hypothetical protein
MKQAIELHRQRIPWRLLLLDAFGAVLTAAGVLELLQTGPQLLPEALRSRGTAVALVVLGVIMMMAVPLWLLQQHRHRREASSRRPQP